MKHILSSNSETKLHNTNIENACQPNAVDLRIDRVFGIVENSTETYFSISETEKHHREKVEIHPDSKGYFRFEPDKTYEVTFEGTVSIGPNEAGFVITRSTLNRNGLFFTSGLYDSGYSGAMAGALHNHGGYSFIQKGTRVGQFLLWQAESLKQYDGSYGFTADGKMKADEQRYHS